MAIQKTLAITLRKREIRETSILFNFYTKDFGKVKALMKGVRSPQPQFGGTFEPFTLNRIVFYEKRTKDVFTLSQCELVDYFPAVRSDLERLAYASYFAELVDEVSPLGDRNEGLFRLLLDSLLLLSRPGRPRRATRVFEIKILNLLGFMPVLKRCSECGRDIFTKVARFSLASGGLLCGSCRAADETTMPVSAGTVNFIERICGAGFDKVSRLKATGDVEKETDRLLGDFIAYHLDVNLKTMGFMRDVGLCEIGAGRQG